MFPIKMSINFNRNTAQVKYEQIISVPSPDELALHKDDFESHILTIGEANALQSTLKADALDFFFNGALCFAEGIDNVCQDRYSWAAIKLYYSIYYMLRASLAAKGYAILRCKRVYRLHAKVGEKPVSKPGKNFSTTHEGTIGHYKDLFSTSDRLLTNTINSFETYEWMKDIREIVNYRSSTFLEPEFLSIWDTITQWIEDGKLKQLLEQFENDEYVLCFQEEYAVIAIPFKRIIQTIDDFRAENIALTFRDDRLEILRKTIGYEKHKLTILPSLFRV